MRAAIAAVLGTATILGAFAFLLANPGGVSDSALLIALAALVGVVGAIGALVKVAGSGAGDEVAPAPWEDSGSLVDRAPERSPSTHDVSGERLATLVADAGETARDDGTVAAGVEEVRPHLREALVGVFVRGGTDRRTAEQAIERGTWTDDATAAAALDGAVDHPGWSVFERFEAWLFPEQVVRTEVRTAMQAIADVADRELPTVPGQRAPRTVPVLEPTLEDLRRGADGHLQRAVEPLPTRTDPAVGDPTTVDEPDPSREGSGRNDTDSTRESPTESLDGVDIGGRSDERSDREVAADE